MCSSDLFEGDVALVRGVPDGLGGLLPEGIHGGVMGPEGPQIIPLPRVDGNLSRLDRFMDEDFNPILLGALLSFGFFTLLYCLAQNPG